MKPIAAGGFVVSGSEPSGILSLLEQRSTMSRRA